MTMDSFEKQQRADGIREEKRDHAELMERFCPPDYSVIEKRIIDNYALNYQAAQTGRFHTATETRLMREERDANSD